jgi:hypothetical protein
MVGGNLVLGSGKWDSLKMGILDSCKTIVAEWAHLEFLAVPVLASFWVGLSYKLARQRLRGTNAALTREAVASRDKSFVAFSLLAAAAETVILAIREYGNENPSFLDNWQQALGLIRSLPQVVALGILVVGASWVWRRTETQIPLQQQDSGVDAQLPILDVMNRGVDDSGRAH